MATNDTTVLTPVGRIIMGDLYNPRTTDMDNRPLVYKSGAKAGQPRKDYFFALAIPKGTEANGQYGAFNWAQTPWGQAIWNAGHAFMSHASRLPAFAWKVSDGDSTVPNGKGNKLSDNPDARGCWILFFNGTMMPRLCNNDGSQQLGEPDAIRPGYFVQVAFTCEGNGNQQKPGVYLNAQAVALQAYGKVISYGINTAAVGFGQGVALPPGASTTPLPGMGPAGAPAPQPAAAGLPPMPGAAPAPVAAPPVMQPQQQVPPPMPAPAGGLPPLPNVQPNMAILQPAAAPAMVPPPVVAPAPPAGLRQTGAYTIEQLRAAGYSDDQMIAAGFAAR